MVRLTDAASSGHLLHAQEYCPSGFSGVSVCVSWHGVVSDETTERKQWLKHR